MSRLAHLPTAFYVDVFIRVWNETLSKWTHPIVNVRKHQKQKTKINYTKENDVSFLHIPCMFSSHIFFYALC
jgi:hypothetical protein